MKYLALGKRLKNIREARGISLSELSQRIGLPEEELKEYESDRKIPRIGILIKISKVLSINVADIFRDRPKEKAYELLKKQDREQIHPLLEARESRVRDYLYEPLSLPSHDKHLDAYLIEVPPHQAKPPQGILSHPGEEFVYLLEGKLKAEIQGEEVLLEAGDSLFLHSEYPHIFYNPFEETARALTVIYPY